MKVLFDAVHAADVWTLGVIDERLASSGHQTLWVSRPGKENVVELIVAKGKAHVRGPRAGTTRPSLARELLARDLQMWRTVRSFRPDVIVTRSPAAVHAGRLTRTPVLYDSDDGRSAGMLHYLAAPFAHLTTGPTAGGTSRSRRHRCYRGYKELFYLHPSRFRPDPSIRSEIGARRNERLFLLRLTAFTATHDRGHIGLNEPQIDAVVTRLSRHGRVLISSETDPPPRLAALEVPTAPDRFHHVLAACDLVVGDSQTVCSEAAVVGTPSIRFSTWAGRHAYQVELQRRWELTSAFATDDEAGFLTKLDDSLADLDGVSSRHRRNLNAMLQWCGDPVADVITWIHELAESR